MYTCTLFDLYFRSTAELENFNNLILMYSGKRFAFSPPVYNDVSWQHWTTIPMLTGKLKEILMDQYSKKLYF